ncbi:MAG: FecR domain-containing protein [Polyangiales bacterium]
MTDPISLSRLATDRLRRASDASVPPPSAAVRDQTIALLGAAIAEQAQRRRRKRIAGIAIVAIAASLAATVSVKLLHRPSLVPAKEAVRLIAHPSGPVAVVHGGVLAPMSASAILVDGDRVRTETESHASVVLSTGTQIDVDEKSELAVASTSAEQAFVAAAGGSKFSVAKLGPGERFLVRTADTEVEVRGTIFRVSVAATECKGTRTRVEVTEGTVVVRHHGDEVRLAKSERWPTGCFEPATVVAPPQPVEEPVQAPAKLLAPAPTHVAPAALTAPSPSSDLAAQNDLFAEGVAKKRAGDKIGAALVFDRFLTRWPSSSLAESAAVERMRLLGGEPARAAAKDYLARFPKGAAHAEAESIAH